MGHVGRSDKTCADRIVRNTVKQCSRCGSCNIIKTGSSNKIITEIPSVKAETVCHIVEKYRCQNCDVEFNANDLAILKTEFGPNLLAFVSDLSDKRISLRGIADMLYGQFGLRVCHRTIENALEPVTDRLS